MMVIKETTTEDVYFRRSSFFLIRICMVSSIFDDARFSFYKSSTWG